MKILWCITGAGHKIRAVVDLMKFLKDRYGIKITIALSRWGFNVVRIYGLIDKIRSIASGSYYEEVLVEDEGFYYLGRLTMRRYDVVVIAPATSNTIAKIVHGIADTLPTAVFAQSQKAGIPIVVMPTDVPEKDGFIVSEAPCYVDRTLCRCLEYGEQCSASTVCPVNAIHIVEGKARIDLSKCIGCIRCVEVCRYGAIRCWEKVLLKPRTVDLENIERLKTMEGVIVVSDVEELKNVLLKFVEGKV